MKRVHLSILFLFVASLANAIDIATKVESVTIYHSGALVVRTASEDLQPGVHELVFRNVSSKIILNSLKIQNKEITVLNKSMIRKLTAEEFSQLQDKKDALMKQMSLIEAKYNEVGFVSKVEDLENMTAFYANKMLEIKKNLREVESAIAEARKLEEVKIENSDAAILKLVVSVDGSMKDQLRLQYVCGGVGWSPAYDITSESSSSNSIQIKYLAKAMSQTGEDWDNVVVILSSSFPLEAPTKLPKAGNPWVIGEYSNNADNFISEREKQQSLENQQIKKLEGVEYEEVTMPSFLKVRKLGQRYSIKSNNTVFTFPVENVTLPANYYYYGYPGIESEVYLVAEVTGWDTLGFVDGVASITYAGNDLGKSVINFSENKDTLLLPIGKDNSIFMKRKEIADQKYFKEKTVGRREEITLAYEIELKNNNSFPVKFVQMEQLPISQTKSAEVEIIQQSGGEYTRETGEMAWFLKLDPGDGDKKSIIYKIEADYNYSYSYSHSRATVKRVRAKF